MRRWELRWASRRGHTRRAALVAGLTLASACGQVTSVASEDDEPNSTATVSPTATFIPTTGANQPSSTATTSPATTATSTVTSAATTAVAEAPLPTGPPELAAALSDAERAIRDPGVSVDEALSWGRRLQRLYRVLSANPDWWLDTIRVVDETVRPDVELNWSARQSLSALLRGGGSPSTTLPAWRIREPLPVDELLSYYQEAESTTGVGWEILAAIHLIETRMGRIEGLSTAGAIGPMQFLPSTWAECCEGDPTLDRDAIIGAGTYLVRRGAATDLDRAIWGYNNSDNYVAAVRAYAEIMERNELAYRGFHAFEVYFLSSAGLIRMPTGYEELEAVDAATWLADNPEALVE